MLSCVTVVLYYVNLSSLCESPKASSSSDRHRLCGQRSEALQVQFHQTSGGSVTEENQFESISLKEPESREVCLGWGLGVHGKLGSVVVLAS